MQGFKGTKVSLVKLRYLIFATVLVSISACGGGGGGESAKKQPPNSSNRAPTIQIISPLQGGNQSELEQTLLIANASDEEDGDISDRIEWVSNIDGNLGTGTNITIQLTNGAHSIAASVRDSQNAVANQDINYSINPAFGNATLSWTAPTENTDDSELTDLAGFKIYYGTSVDNLDIILTIEANDVSAYVIENLEMTQTYYFAISAYNQLGIESELSTIASKTISI